MDARDLERRPSVDTVHAPSPASARVPFLAWISLAFAVVSTAVVGPGFLFLERAGATPLVLITWRMECVFLYLLPFSLYELAVTPRRIRRLWLDRETAKAVVLAGVGWGGTLICYITSLLFTSTVRASLLSSLTPLVLAIQYRISGKPISNGEIWGVVIATVGMIICFLSSSDPERSSDFGLSPAHTAPDGSVDATAPTTTSAPIVAGHALMGDLLATAASVFTAMDVEYSVQARQSIPLFVFSSACSLVVIVLTGLCAALLEGTSFSMSNTGFFGWLMPEYLIPMLVFSFAVGFLAIVGFNHSVKYVAPLLFSVIILLDPVLTGILSFGVGLESLPSFWTFVGGSIVTGGIVLVIVNEGDRAKH